jgi:hypothetical protein
MRFRRQALLPLDEAAAYARCHGTRTPDVRIVHLPPRRPRFDVLADGEKLRRHFEARLDARELEQPGAQPSGAGQLVDAPDPGVDPREASLEPEMVPEDLVEPVRVALLPDDRVLEERESGDVRE